MNIDYLNKIAPYLAKNIEYIEKRMGTYYFYDKNMNLLPKNYILKEIEKNEHNDNIFNIYQIINSKNKNDEVDDLLKLGFTLDLKKLPEELMNNKSEFFGYHKKEVSISEDEDSAEIYSENKQKEPFYPIRKGSENFIHAIKTDNKSSSNKIALEKMLNMVGIEDEELEEILNNSVLESSIKEKNEKINEYSLELLNEIDRWSIDSVFMRCGVSVISETLKKIKTNNLSYENINSLIYILNKRKNSGSLINNLAIDSILKLLNIILSFFNEKDLNDFTISLKSIGICLKDIDRIKTLLLMKYNYMETRSNNVKRQNEFLLNELSQINWQTLFTQVCSEKLIEYHDFLIKNDYDIEKAVQFFLFIQLAYDDEIQKIIIPIVLHNDDFFDKYYLIYSYLFKIIHDYDSKIKVIKHHNEINENTVLYFRKKERIPNLSKFINHWI